MLYNPETRKPVAILKDIKDVTYSKFAGYFLQRAVDSKEEVLRLDTEGHVYWLEGDRIMRAYLVSTDFWRPIDDTGVHIPGINWGNEYFRTKAAAEDFRQKLLDKGYRQVGWPTYDEVGDTWHIHYHYEY